MRGRDLRGRAELIAPDSAEFRQRAETSFRRMPWLRRVFGIDTAGRNGLSDAQVAHLGHTAAIVRIGLDGTAG